MNTLTDILDKEDTFSKMTSYSITLEILNMLSEKFGGSVTNDSLFHRNIFKIKIDNKFYMIVLNDYQVYNENSDNPSIKIFDLTIKVDGLLFYIPIFNVASSFGSYYETADERLESFITYLRIRGNTHPCGSKEIDDMFCLDFKPSWKC